MICLFSAVAQKRIVSTHDIDWQHFLHKHDLCWDKITDDYYAGAIIGNGLLGANLYKSDAAAYRFDVGRTDITEGRGSLESEHYQQVGVLFDEARLPIGYFLMRPQGTVESEKMRLSLYDAINSGSIQTDKGRIDFKTYVHATKNYILFESEAGGEEIAYGWEWNPLTAISPRTKIHGVPTGYTANPEVKNRKDGDYNLSIQNLLSGKTYVTAWKEVKNGNKRRIAITLSYENSEEKAVNVAKQTLDNCLSTNEKTLEDTHKSWWHNYYPASFITFADSRLESFFWIQQYKFASASRKDKKVLDLQGPWARDNTPWPAVWFNLNIQLTYSWQNTANRPELMEPLWKALNDNVSNLIRNVTDNPGQETWNDAAGLGRSGSYDFKRLLDPSLADINQYETGNLTWILFYYWQYCVYNNRTNELKERFFPLLKRAIAYYAHIRTKDADGKYHLPKTASPEYKAAEDCNYDLSVLRWGLNTLIDINTQYFLNDPQQKQWEDFRDNLVDYPQTADHGFSIGKNVTLDGSHRHYSHLLMIYPLYLINWEQAENREIITKSVNRWQSLTGALQGYSFTGSSAMYASMGEGNRALTQLEALLRRYIQPNTLYKESGPVIETPFAALASAMDLYIQSWGGKIRVFPAVPTAWTDAAFIRLRTEGSFLLSASRKQSKTVFIQVESEAGGRCRLQTDMALNTVKVQTPEGKNIPYKVMDKQLGLIEFDTHPGDIVQLSDTKFAKTLPSPIEHPENEANPYGVNRRTGGKY
jgi:hypothetical protein